MLRSWQQAFGTIIIELPKPNIQFSYEHAKLFTNHQNPSTQNQNTEP